VPMRISNRRLAVVASTIAIGFGSSAEASAYLFWIPPDFRGAPVQGDEPGIALPLPNATPAEVRASLLWNMRAGLNVAALQCQFSPVLMTVRNYNNLLSQHSRELTAAYTTITGYFRRTGGRTWQTQLDQYTTRTYNGFSTLHGQLGFCETAASIGREALTRARGSLHLTAQTRMREFRNSLVPVEDGIMRFRPMIAARSFPSFDPRCWTKKNVYRERRECPTPVS